MNNKMLFSSILLGWFLLLAPCSWAEYVVENKAVPGYNSTQVLSAVESRVKEAPAFQYAFVMVGMNDALWPENSVSLILFELRIKSILQKLHAAGVTTYLAEVIPVIDEYLLERHPTLPGLPNDIIDDYNLAIHRAAESTVPPTPIVPMHTFFLPHVNYTADSWVRNEANGGGRNGNHPTAQGAYQIAFAYRLKLAGPIANERRVVLFGDSITFGSGLPSANSPPVILDQLLKTCGVSDWTRYH